MENSIGYKIGNFQTESNVIMLHKHSDVYKRQVGGCCTTVAKHVEEVVRAKKRFSEEQKLSLIHIFFIIIHNKITKSFLKHKNSFYHKISKMYTYICIVPNLIVDFLKNNK